MEDRAIIDRRAELAHSIKGLVELLNKELVKARAGMDAKRSWQSLKT
jgi:hypothetical protein